MLPASYRSLYVAVLEPVLDHCLQIDAGWLADQHPQVWLHMRALDAELDRLVRDGAGELRFRTVAARLAIAVQDAFALYGQEQAGAVQ